jgi:hypothetical protein
LYLLELDVENNGIEVLPYSTLELAHKAAASVLESWMEPNSGFYVIDDIINAIKSLLAKGEVEAAIALWNEIQNDSGDPEGEIAIVEATLDKMP